MIKVMLRQGTGIYLKYDIAEYYLYYTTKYYAHSLFLHLDSSTMNYDTYCLKTISTYKFMHMNVSMCVNV